MRTRIFDRFAELRAEREQLQAQLDALDTTTAQPADISLLDQLPLTANPLPRLTPQLKALLFQALNLEILWNPADRQATVWVEITDTTLRAIPAILDPGHDGHHDTNPEHGPDQPAPTCDFDKPPRTGTTAHRPGKSGAAGAGWPAGAAGLGWRARRAGLRTVSLDGGPGTVSFWAAGPAGGPADGESGRGPGNGEFLGGGRGQVVRAS
jgi:hypothetical protein